MGGLFRQRKQYGRRQALVRRSQTALPNKPPKESVTKGFFHGVFEVQGFRFETGDGNTLGLAAFVMRIVTPDVVSPHFPAGSLKLRVSAADTPARADVLAREHRAGTGRGSLLHAGLHGHESGRSENRELPDWWNKDLLPSVVARISEHLRVNPQLAYGLCPGRLRGRGSKEPSRS